MNEIADNFFDVLNELKTVDKTNAVGEAMNSESRDRLSIDNMTERQYNNFGWVTVNNVMSYEEYGSLMHQFDDFKNRKHSYPTTENGEALIIAYDNEHNATKLAGIKGTTANPIVSFVVDSVNTDDYLKETYFEILRSTINYEKEIRQAFGSLLGEENFVFVNGTNYPTFRELKQQRRSSEKGRKNSESFLYGSGSGGENSETGYVSNEPSSTDGGFSMPDNQNYSTKRNATDKDNAESELASKAFEVNRRVSQLRAKRDEIMRTNEYKTAINQGDDDIDNFIKRYADYLKSSGLDKVNSDLAKAEKEYENLKKQLNEMYSNRVASEEAAAIKASGGDRAEYFRKSAVKEFGYTPYFYDAGYVLPNGKMLNFSGEKGKHYGSRGQDHRGISTIYANLDGTAAMNDFINMGNIRIMAESPGIDISSSAAPTAEQYVLIKRFAKEIGRQKGYFSIDFSDENGRSAGNYEYEGSINPDRIINDIKYFFENGVTREQSVTSQFHYSKSREAEYMTAAESGDTETAQRMVDEAAKAAGYNYHLYHGTNAQFTVFNTTENGGKNGKGEGYGIYLASNKEISEPYGSRVIDSYVKFNRLAYGDKKTITLKELTKLVKSSCEQQAQEYVDNEEYDSVNEAILDTWVSNYVYTYGYSSMSTAFSDVAKTIFNSNSNDGDIINEVMAASGNHYSYENANKFYNELLTPILGIDGFVYKWSTSDVYLAFNSLQIKSADPVTYDDNGNIIPLSERFNEQNDDIRYSIRRDIVDDNGNHYGKGVYLDSNFYEELDEKEKVNLLRDFVENMVGSKYTITLSNGKKFKFTIKQSSEKFFNGKKNVSVNRDLKTNFSKSEHKQQSIGLFEELLSTAKMVASVPATHSHDWVDNFGKNNWNYLETVVQDKNNTVKKAILHFANSRNGENVLYDISIVDADANKKSSGNSLPVIHTARSNGNSLPVIHIARDNATIVFPESQDFSEKREQSNLSAYELSEFVSMSDELLEQKRIAEANANELNNLTEFPARKLNQNDIASVVKDLCNTTKAHR